MSCVYTVYMHHRRHHPITTPPPTTHRWAQQLAGLDFLPPLPTTTHTEDTTALEHNIPTYRTQQRMVHVLTRLRQRAQAHAALTCVYC